MQDVLKNEAIISWIPASRGGRRFPPKGDGYSTVARFENDRDASRGFWSVRLVNVIDMNESRCVRANIEFLCENAPHELLTPGERFELVEGAKVVGKGVVIPPETHVPDRLSEFDLVLLG